MNIKKIWAAALVTATLMGGCGGGGGSVPEAPTGLTVTIGDNAGELTIAWTASTGAISSNLYWGTATGVTPSTGTKIEGATSPYSHTGLTDGTRYYYVATAANDEGESTASTEADSQPQINPVGTLDTTLASTGFVVFAAPEGYANGVAVDAEGRIVMAGSIIEGANFSMAVWRYNADGTPDTTFSGDGLATVIGTAGGNMDEGNGLAIDSSGRILVTGYSNSAAAIQQMAIWRFNSDGTADTSFGSGGYVLYDRGVGGNNAGNDIALDANGRILIAGYAENAVPDSDMALWRYTDAGALDTAFGSGGVVFQNNSAGGDALDMGWGLAIDSSGGIAVVGWSDAAGDPLQSDLAVWRFTDAGVLDASFSGDGVVLLDRGENDVGFGVTFDAQGRVLVVGNSAVAAVADAIVARYTAAGELDSTFGGDGIVTYRSGNGDGGLAIQMDSRQRIVVSGTSGLPVPNYNDMLLFRLTDDGSFDTAFGTNGVVLFDNGAQDTGSSLAFDATGRILVAGSTEEPGVVHMMFWRYQ